MADDLKLRCKRGPRRPGRASRLVVAAGAGLMVLLLAGCGGGDESSSSDRAQAAAEQRKLRASERAAARATRSPEPTAPEPSRAPSVLWPHAAIPGASATDVIQGLARFGLTDFERRDYEAPDLPEGFVREADAADPDTGAQLNARIVQDSKQDVREVECTITGDLALAPDFLSFCASLPYDDATPQAAADWARQQSDVVTAGNPQERTFGSARYAVAGGPVVRFVTITGL